MSKTTAALEAAVAVVLANKPAAGERQTNRQRVEGERAFATVLKLIAPRIRHFTRQYGLTSHWEDAEQACAIGAHRAIESYDPTKAQFTTFVNWQLRGELQDLRFRLMTDQRPSAKKVSATTVSLHAVTRSGGEGDEAYLEALIEDEDALERTEAGAAEHMAATTRARLIDDYLDHLQAVGLEQLKRRARTRAIPQRSSGTATPRLRSEIYPVDQAELNALSDKIALHREAIERRLADDGTAAAAAAAGDEADRERMRQVAKRAAATIADIADRSPRFADALRTPAPTRYRRSASLAAARD